MTNCISFSVDNTQKRFKDCVDCENEIRKNMVKQIINYILSIIPNSIQYCISNIKKLAISFEGVFHCQSITYEEYSNPLTLRQRVGNIIRELGNTNSTSTTV